MSVDTLNEYVEPITELFTKYIDGDIYYSTYEESNHTRTTVEICTEGNINQSDFEYVSIGVKLMVNLDPLIDLTVKHISDEDLKTYFNTVYDPIKIDSIMIYPENTNNNFDYSYFNMLIKPGLGFGTGKHPTTKLCLEQLQKIDNKYVLDIGTGSAILSIASFFFGATKAIGLDSDDMALSNAKYNISLNKLNSKIELIKLSFEDYPTGNLFDTVYANVGESFLHENIQIIYDLIKPKGNLIISGFKESRRNKIYNLYSKIFKVIECKSEHDWSCMRLMKNETK